MLQKIRDNATNGFAFIMLGLLILAFAVWGVDFQFGGSQVIVEVDGEEVPSYQIVNAYNQQIQQFQQFYPNGIPEIQQEQLKQRVVESFVRNQLLVAHTSSNGFGMPDTSVRDAIRNTPGFQVDGKFNPASFEYAANRSGFTPDGLYNEFRQSLVMQQLAQGLTDTAFVTADEIRTRGALEREARTVRTLRIEAQKLATDMEVDPAEVESTYEFNQADYMTEETVRLDYIELDPARIAAAFEVDDAAVLERYEAGVASGEFSRPETRNGRHLLIAINSDKNEEQARTEAVALRARILAGEDFAELAAEFSDDAGSKPQGGELGWNTRDAYVGPFGDALFSMVVNDISEPIKTRFGYHVIRLEGVRKNENQPLEEVREQLVTELKEDRARDELSELMLELDEVVYDVDDTLAEAAATAGVEVQQTAWFTRGSGAGIASSAPVRDVAYSDQVLNDGLNSNAIEVDGKFVYVRLNEHRPANLMTLEEVRPRIITEIKNSKAIEKAETIGSEQLAKLQSGTAFSEIAEGLESDLGESRAIQRTERELPPALVTSIFAAAKPGDEPVFGGARANNGDYLLFELQSVAAGEALDEAQKVEYARATANMEFAAYISALREKAKVITRPELLSQ